MSQNIILLLIFFSPTVKIMSKPFLVCKLYKNLWQVRFSRWTIIFRSLTQVTLIFKNENGKNPTNCNFEIRFPSDLEAAVG